MLFEKSVALVPPAVFGSRPSSASLRVKGGRGAHIVCVYLQTRLSIRQAQAMMRTYSKRHRTVHQNALNDAVVYDQTTRKRVNLSEPEGQFRKRKKLVDVSIISLLLVFSQSFVSSV